MFADQFGWLKRGHWGRTYARPMECLGYMLNAVFFVCASGHKTGRCDDVSPGEPHQLFVGLLFVFFFVYSIFCDEAPLDSRHVYTLEPLIPKKTLQPGR